MEGDPAGRQDDPPDLADGATHADPTVTRQRSLLFPILTLALFFGLVVAGAAIVRSGVLSANGQEIADDNGNWRISAFAIAVLAAAWLAGVVCLVRLLLRNTIGPRPAWAGWLAMLAAFSLGPALVALFFAVLNLARYPAHRLVAYPLAAAVLVVLVLARRPLQLLAERLLLSFFLWLAIMFAPIFWRDEVSRQMSDFLFGWLTAAGLLN